MMPLILDWARDVAEVLPHEGRILEVGARPASGQESMSVRSLFPGADYLGTDIQEGPNVDQVEDVHDLSFEDGTFGTVIALETLEHVKDPIRAVAEMHRVLRPGGVLALSSPSLFFAIHAHPWDYWRFTPECFSMLLENFDSRFVASYGFSEMPQHVFGVGIKKAGADPRLEQFPRLSHWIADWGIHQPVDLGPIRMTTRKLLTMAARESAKATRRRAAGLAGRARRT